MEGESKGRVAGTVLASTKGSVAIKEGEDTQECSIEGGTVTYTLYVTSIPAEAPLIDLYAAERPSCHLKSDLIAAHVNVIFLECPFGFNLTGVDGAMDLFICQCDVNPVIINCSIQLQIISKQRFSWVGMYEVNDDTHLATNSYCPLDYCNPAFQDIKSYPDYLDQDEQCQYNRTGVLCGSCPEGWSLVLGSSECRECSSVWLLLILPFALAGLLLVVVVNFLNLTVTMGTVCGLIFYANVMQDFSVVLLSKNHPIPVLTPVLQVFLSWLNLDLSISTCFYDGMEAFGKTMLLFVFPIYIWLISAAIIILSNHFVSFMELFGEKATKVLATLILLSYSKILRVVFGSLDLTYIKVHVDSSNSMEVARWAVDGNIPYLNLQRHLVLFVLAIVSLFLLLPFSFSLLCIRHVYCLSNCSSRLFSWIDKLKPFYDAYVGPFKDKGRFWTGLLLFVRLSLLTVDAFDYKNSVTPFYIVTAVCLFLMAFMFTLGGVYKKNHLNILEFFFILNMCAVFLINTYKRGSEFWTSILSHLLVSSAFLAFLGIVAYHTYLRFLCLGSVKRLRCPHADGDSIDDRWESISSKENEHEYFEQKCQLLEGMHRAD